jgi:L-lactate dehydrogenase (cytochrome)
MLSDILDAVGDKIEVHFDGGIRSGQYVLKATAMGAKGTYIVRPFLYGLGAMGQKGVTKALEVIHKELDFSMALGGHRQLSDVSQKDLLIPKDFNASDAYGG